MRDIKDEFICLKAIKGYINQYIFNDARSSRMSGMTIQSKPDLSEGYLDDSYLLIPNLSPTISTNQNMVFKRLNNIELDDYLFDKPFDPSQLEYSLCIDRVSFLSAMGNEVSRKFLITLMVCANTVCFSLLMPKDKGDIVKLLKENVKFKPLVVAVGDGEGDISMLQTANVGISVNTH